MFVLNKFSLIILTRCNLKCRLCCEYVPQHAAFPDMTEQEEAVLLKELFRVADHVQTLHLTGGGEPFLHQKLPELIEQAMEYETRFDTLMLFTNATIPVSEGLKKVLSRWKDRILVQVSRYGLYPEREEQVIKALRECGVRCKEEKYYGEEQSFGGWVDFGTWDRRLRTERELSGIFQNCSVTRVLHGNWRTRDGKVHWCSRSQRGMELGEIPDCPGDYVDLLDDRVSVEEKRRKFEMIAEKDFLSACQYCSGDAGTEEKSKRYPAAEQQKGIQNDI